MIHSQFLPSFVASLENIETANLLLVLGAHDSLPQIFETPPLVALIASKRKNGKKFVLKIDAFSHKICTLHILVIAEGDDIATEIAECAREIKGDVAIAVMSGINVPAAMEAFGLGVYVFDCYLTDKKPRNIKIVTAASQWIEDAIGRVNAVYLARDLVNMPPNEKYPQKLAHLIASLEWKNTKLRILEKAELEKEGF